MNEMLCQNLSNCDFIFRELLKKSSQKLHLSIEEVIDIMSILLLNFSIANKQREFLNHALVLFFVRDKIPIIKDFKDLSEALIELNRP